MTKLKLGRCDTADVKHLISALTGLAFSGNRVSSLDRALNTVLKTRSALTLATLVERLKDGDELVNDVIEELLIHETYFFREADSLNALVSHIETRASLSAARGSSLTEFATNQFRLWCAGCSTGEEAYSLAILLLNSSVRDCFGIIATDLSGESLQLARNADYSSWSLRTMSEELKNQHFKQEGKRYQLKNSKAKERVHFQQANLISSRPLPPDWYPLDAIVCRNVLIYFERTTIASVANIFFNSLAPGGFVLTGASDPSLASYAPFECESTSVGPIYRRPDTSLAPSFTPNFALKQVHESSGPMIVSTTFAEAKNVLLPQESSVEVKRLLEKFRLDEAKNTEPEISQVQNSRLSSE